jgi:hypothetical protein
MRCPECNTVNDESAVFCSNCGTDLEWYRIEGHGKSGAEDRLRSMALRVPRVFEEDGLDDTGGGHGSHFASEVLGDDPTYVMDERWPEDDAGYDDGFDYQDDAGYDDANAFEDDRFAAVADIPHQVDASGLDVFVTMPSAPVDGTEVMPELSGDTGPLPRVETPTAEPYRLLEPEWADEFVVGATDSDDLAEDSAAETPRPISLAEAVEDSKQRTRSRRRKGIIISCTAALVVAIALAVLMHNRIRPLDAERVTSDLNQIGFANETYGDPTYTPVTGYAVTASKIGSEEDAASVGRSLFRRIVHRESSKELKADVKLSNGFYDVVLPVDLMYHYQDGRWVLDQTIKGDPMISPSRGIDFQSMSSSTLLSILEDDVPSVADRFSDPTVAVEDSQSASGGQAIIHLAEAPASRPLFDYRADVTLFTSFADGRWHVRVADADDVVVSLNTDKLTGTWEGSLVESRVSSGVRNTPCSAAGSTTPLLTISSSEDGTSFAAAISFEQHQHGMFLQAEAVPSPTLQPSPSPSITPSPQPTPVAPATIKVIDADRWVDGLSLSNFQINDDGTTFQASYGPFSGESDTVSIEGAFSSDGSISMTIVCRYPFDDEGNRYDGIYDQETGTYLGPASIYTDTYSMQKRE